MIKKLLFAAFLFISVNSLLANVIAPYDKPLHKKPFHTTSSIIAADVDVITGSPYNQLGLLVYTNQSESSWWVATFRIHTYYYGITGGDLRHGYTYGWQWGYCNWTCEVPPGETSGLVYWDLSGGQVIDDQDWSIISFQPE